MGESRPSGPPAARPVPGRLSAAEIYCSWFWGLETPSACGLGFWSSTCSATSLKFQAYTAALLQVAPLRTWPAAAWMCMPRKGRAVCWSRVVPFRCPLVGQGAGPGLGGICRGDQCPHLLPHPHLRGPSPAPTLLALRGCSLWPSVLRPPASPAPPSGPRGLCSVFCCCCSPVGPTVTRRPQGSCTWHTPRHVGSRLLSFE